MYDDFDLDDDFDPLAAVPFPPYADTGDDDYYDEVLAREAWADDEDEDEDWEDDDEWDDDDFDDDDYDDDYDDDGCDPEGMDGWGREVGGIDGEWKDDGEYEFLK